MSEIAVRRVKRELKRVVEDREFEQCGVHFEVINDNFMELKGKLTGPPETPYEGGIFVLYIKLPLDYPFKPPRMQFVTKIWHPNISSTTGMICLDILRGKWMSAMTLRTALLSIQALLSAAEPDHPLESAIAMQYKTEYEVFKLTAQHWTQAYAGAPGSNPEFEAKIEAIRSLGVTKQRARAALSSCSWKLDIAASSLFNE